jgi:hypothetical protein
MAKLTIQVDSHPDTKTVTVRFIFPAKTIVFSGNLESLRKTVEGGLPFLAAFVGADALRDVQIDMGRILKSVEEEFGEVSGAGS